MTVGYPGFPLGLGLGLPKGVLSAGEFTPAPEGDERVTSEGDTRVTSEGDVRVYEE